jgi:hypothetical protein
MNLSRWVCAGCTVECQWLWLYSIIPVTAAVREFEGPSSVGDIDGPVWLQNNIRYLVWINCMKFLCRWFKIWKKLCMMILTCWQHCDSEPGLLGIYSSASDKWCRSFMWSTPQFSVFVCWQHWEIIVTQHTALWWTFIEDVYQILWKSVPLEAYCLIWLNFKRIAGTS